MTAVPVINSILSPKSLALWVGEQYGFHEVSGQVIRTNHNHTYLIAAAEGKAVLRVYAHKHRSALEIADELRLLRLLKGQGLEVAYPLPDLDGEFILELLAPEGPRYAVLFSFARGSKMRFISPELSRNIGMLTGRFHQLTQYERTGRTTYTIGVLASWACGQVAARFPDSKEELDYLYACAERLGEVFGSAEALRRGIVHLDIWYDNMRICSDGQITLFDFDNLGNGWLVLDIGYYCMQLYNIEGDKTVYEQKKAAFLEGYQSVLPISDDELKLVPYAGLAIWIYYLGLQAERFESSGNLFLSANYISMYMSRAKEWLNYCGLAVG